MYLFCPLTNTLPIDDARPLTKAHEYVELIEITLLEHIHETNFNHQLYNLSQNTNQEFSTPTEEVENIRPLGLLLHLLRTKNVIRTVAKLLITSDTTKTTFPHEFYPETEPTYAWLLLKPWQIKQNTHHC